MPTALTVVNPNRKVVKVRDKVAAFTDGKTPELYLFGLIPLILFGVPAIGSLCMYGIVSLTSAIFSSIVAFIGLTMLTVFFISKTDKNTIRMTGTGRYGEYYHTLVRELKEIRGDCQFFKNDVASDKFLKESISRVETSAEKLEWDIACYWRTVRVYLHKGTRITEERVAQSFKDFRLQVDEFKQIIANLTDTAFKYSVVEKSEDHLKILQTDIKIMIESMEEAYAQSQLALNPGKDENEFRAS